MEHEMDNRKFKLGLLLPILVLVALFAAFWAASILYPPQQSHKEVPSLPAGTTLSFSTLPTPYSLQSTLHLLSILVITYVSIYNKTKSEFSFGLVIFAGIFLLKDITSSPFVSSPFGFFASGLGPFAVLPDLFEFAALTVLVYLSIKY